MKLNSAMGRIVREGLPALSDLPLGLQETLEAGWLVGPARALLLATAYGEGRGWRDDWSPEEVANEEYQVNDIYIESSGLPVRKNSFQAIMASRALSFAIGAMLRARGIGCSDKLVGVVSISDDEDYLVGGTVRFFTRRGKYPQSYDGNLETYSLEAIAVLDMQDAESWPGVAQ